MTRYWKCQLACWSAMGLTGVAIPFLYAGRMRWVFLGRGLAGALLGLLLTDRLRRLIHSRGWLRMPPRALAPRLAAASLLVAALMVLGALPFLLAIIKMPRTGPLAVVFAVHAAIVFGWSATYAGLHYLRGMRLAESGRRGLEVSPHFLFNSLNSVRALVGEDPVRAQEAISGLAVLLRHTLRLGQAQTTTLGVELQATRRYLELEALRYESRLRYEIEADEGSLEHPVPPLLVQTLVENAVKHGIARRPQGGALRVAARTRSDALHVRVTNTGRLEGGAGAGGIGMANALERLRLAFGERARLELRQSGPDEVTCEVMIPGPATAAAR